MIYPLVDQWQQKAVVTQACRVLDVSRSGYYSANVAASMRAMNTKVCSNNTA